MRTVLSLVLAAGTVPAAAQQAPAPPVSADAAPWHWVHPDRQPSQAWHTDTTVQRQLYDDAYSQMLETVGIDLEERIEVLLAPAFAFAFVQMEVGAKDGSLLLGISSTRAMEWLSFVSVLNRKPTSIGGDWRGEPGSVTSYAAGTYSPRHVKRMIVINCDLDPSRVPRALRHELVHAMQDEVFGFRDFFAFEGITVDETWARQAIEEGYASLVCDDEDTGPALDDLAALDWPIQQLQFTHGLGRQLVERVAPRAASRRELLTLLFEHPPTTTREVLHPELYEQRLDGGSALELPERKSLGLLRDALDGAMSASGSAPEWRSRLGEFGLRALLNELGAPASRSSEIAAGWRNDALVNYGPWRNPTATGVTWCLDGATAATDLAILIRERLGARAPPLQDIQLRLGDEVIAAHATLGRPGWPDALLVQHGESVGLVVGDDLGPAVEALAPAR